MKKAFTMIELIFVIVILGIISSIAVPKLAATREDAKIIKILTDLKTILKDIDVYYAKNGEIEKGFDFRKLTNVSLMPISSYYAYIVDGKQCLRIIADNDDYIVFYQQLNIAKPLCMEAIKRADFLVGGDRWGNKNQMVVFNNARVSANFRGIIKTFE